MRSVTSGIVSLTVVIGALLALDPAGRPSLAVPSSPDVGASTVAAYVPAIAYQWVQGDGDGIFAMAPDWSPDGSRLAFEVAVADTTDIWTSGADGRDRALAIDHADGPDGSFAVTTPAWSPDGRMIAYTRFRVDGEGILRVDIETRDLATGGTRLVATTPTRTVFEDPRWSPDQQSIVFHLTTFSTDTAEVGSETGSAIAVVDASGSGQEPRTLTDRSLYAAYPDWRDPSGPILFTTHDLGEFPGTDAPSNLYTIMPDGSGLTQLTTFGAADQRATQPSWTPDGERILFTLVEQNAGFDWPRRAAFVDAIGNGLSVLPPDATHPRLRPSPVRP